MILRNPLARACPGRLNIAGCVDIFSVYNLWDTKILDKKIMSDKQPFIYVEKLKELRQNILSSMTQMDNIANKSDVAKDLFAEHIKPILDVYQPVISPLASHHGNTIYRARKCIGENPFSNIKELYNRPTPSGRASIFNDMPVLYASSSMQTCLSKIDPEIGNLINIAQFKYTKIMSGQFWFIGQRGLFNKSNEPSHYLGDVSSTQKHVYFAHWAQHSWFFVDSLMNEIFSELSSQPNNYALNGLLINEIRKNLPDKKELDGVVFLSIQDAPGINFAIYGHAINKLEPSIVNLVRITDIDDYGFVAFKLLKNANPRDGLLEWPDEVVPKN